MSLKEKYKDYFLIGAAVNTHTIQTHKDLILREFNSITCENEMKYGEVTNDGVTYDFADADKIVAFAKDNGLAMRMHTLLWHNQSPPPIFKNTDRDRLLQVFRGHVNRMAQRYGKLVYACGVANEVIDDKGSEYFRKSPWLSIIGDDFVDVAFEYAKEAMPNVTLCYNDYNESEPEKSLKIAKLVRDMKNKGIPIDCVGLQAHWNIVSPSVDEIKRAFELYAGLGVKLHITELDVSLFAFEDRSVLKEPSLELIKRQADFYREVFAIFRQYRDIVESITTWGVADDESWLSNFPVPNRKNWPLLFDDNHQSKPCYEAIMDF